MSQENVELVRRSLDAFNRRDLDALARMNHPDVELDWSASRGLQSGVYHGWEEVKGMYETLLDTFEEVKVEPHRFIESGDMVVVPNSAEMRGRDSIKTVARSAPVFELHHGRIARICLYQDTAEALEAVGLSE
jgi:ketosteroid isomerase-like protein